MTSENRSKIFLFSVDFEDVHRMITGSPDTAAIKRNTEAYLSLLDRHRMKCTFFMVGKDALAHPEVVKQIVDAGHEIACHSHEHLPVAKMSAEAFEADLKQNLAALRQAGAGEVVGYRAPILSLTDQCDWAYDILARHGIQYSSSVLPAKNPLYGWPGFGSSPRRIKNVLEIPVTLSPLWPILWPFASGTYFRLLPFWLNRLFFRASARAGVPIVGYFHPYDVDTSEPYREYPELRGRKLLARLMFYQRASVLRRLDRLFTLGYRAFPYSEYAKEEGLKA